MPWSPELAAALSPLDGIWVRTFGALYLATTFLFPFLGLRLVGGEKQTGSLKVQLQEWGGSGAREPGAGRAEGMFVVAHPPIKAWFVAVHTAGTRLLALQSRLAPTTARITPPTWKANRWGMAPRAAQVT